MFVTSSGGGGGSRRVNARHRYGETGKAGWYFWYPFIMGAGFLLGGLFFTAGAVFAPAASGGLGITAIIFVLLGIGFIWWAFAALKDIRSDAQKDEPLPGTLSATAQQALLTSGINATATIKSFGFVAGSSAQGTTLVDLDMDVTSPQGGSISLKHEARIPLKLTDGLKKGATFPVRVSTTDPSVFEPVWEGLVPPSAPPASTPSGPTAPAATPPATSAAPAGDASTPAPPAS